MEEVRAERRDEQDPPTQDENSRPGPPEREPRPKRQRHPPTLLTYNSLGKPTYKTQAAAYYVSAANSVVLRILLGVQVYQPYISSSYLHTHCVSSDLGYLGRYLQYPPLRQPVLQSVNRCINQEAI